MYKISFHLIWCYKDKWKLIYSNALMILCFMYLKYKIKKQKKKKHLFESVSNLLVNELDYSSDRQTGGLVCHQWSVWMPVWGGTACSSLYGSEWSCAHISRCQRCFSQSTAPGSATTAMAEGGEGEDEIQFLRTVSTETRLCLNQCLF